MKTKKKFDMYAFNFSHHLFSKWISNRNESFFSFCNWRYFLCFYFWLLWKLNSLCCCYPSLSFGHVSLLLRQVNKKALNAWGRLLSFRYNLSSFFLGYILCFFLLYRIRVSIYPTNRHRLCFWTVYTNPVEVFFF